MSAGYCAAVWLEGEVAGDSMAGPGELEMILKEWGKEWRSRRRRRMRSQYWK